MHPAPFRMKGISACFWQAEQAPVCNMIHRLCKNQNEFRLCPQRHWTSRWWVFVWDCGTVWSTVWLSEPLQQVGQLNRGLEKSNKMLRRLEGLIDVRKDLRNECFAWLNEHFVWEGKMVSYKHSEWSKYLKGRLILDKTRDCGNV